MKRLTGVVSKMMNGLSMQYEGDFLPGHKKKASIETARQLNIQSNGYMNKARKSRYPV